jgi:hypothetical protein
VKILPTTIAEKGMTRASVRARTLDRLDLWLSVRMALSLSLRLLTAVILQAVPLTSVAVAQDGRQYPDRWTIEITISSSEYNSASSS